MYKKLSWFEKLLLEIVAFTSGSRIGYQIGEKQKEAAEEQERLRTLICEKKQCLDNNA